MSIAGFKSIRQLDDFELRNLNLLIGANGSGKSNFVSFFRMLHALAEQRLQVFTQKEGGADALLHLGPRETQAIAAKLRFDQNSYEFRLTPTPDNEWVFESEEVDYRPVPTESRPTRYGSGHREARMPNYRESAGRVGRFGPERYVYGSITRWVIYHFHDTSETAGVRRQGAINDNEYLREDASNLAAFLFRLKSTDPSCYENIREATRQAAPYFDDFKLRPIPGAEDRIQLEWTQTDSDYPFRAKHLSDGTLRFICMATALLQPSPPATILFDEPELGLHPYALALLAALINQASDRTQIIASTQSAPFLNDFAPEDIVVVEREQGQSAFRRLASADLTEWLADYSLGELWLKNILGGRPRRDDVPSVVRR